MFTIVATSPWYLFMYFQMAQLEESRLCKICFENESDTILFPCSHFCLCHQCSLAVVDKSNSCPVSFVFSFIQMVDLMQLDM